MNIIIILSMLLMSGEAAFAQGPWKAGATPRDKVTAALSEGTLTISGRGKMKDYAYQTYLPYVLEDEKPPWDPYGEIIDKVVIESGVTSIGTGAFSWIPNLRSVAIPGSVKSIGNYAFQGSGLRSIAIPGSVKSIGFDAFSSCKNLNSIDIPSSVISIEMYAFSNCDSLRSVTIHSGMKSFGFTPFYKCKNLTSITILNPAPPLINNDLFRGMNKTNCTLYVPGGSEEAYRSAEYWNYFKNIRPIE